MANTVYPKALNLIATGGIDLATAPVKALLVNASQAYNAAHQFVSDLTSADIIARAAADLTGESATNGVYTAANLTLASVAGGSTVAAIVIYHDTGTDSTSDLLAWIDHDASNNPISLATNGSNITITWNGSGIFSI